MSSADFSIDSLTVLQKLDLMERLWADLSTKPAGISSPDWHGDVLAKRLQEAEANQSGFSDWSDSKKRLQSRYE